MTVSTASRVGCALLAVPLMMAPGWPDCDVCVADTLADDAVVFYDFKVIAGKRYDIVLSPKKGDPDLYVADDAKVSFTHWDCRPYVDGVRDEWCTLVPATSGVRRLMVHAYEGPAVYDLTIYRP